MVGAEEAKTRWLSIRLFDGFALQDADGSPIRLVNRKAAGLLAYLALSPNSSETRERLAGLLWSDRGEEQARASLRQCLKQLRQQFDGFGFRGFKTDRLQITLARDQIAVDIHDIFEDLKSGKRDRELGPEIAPYNILYGFENLDQSFATWLHVIRKNWQDRLIDLLQSNMDRGSDDAARYAAKALTIVDPSHEEAHRHLIRGYADAANTTSALKQYKVLWDLLDEEFDMEPDEETQALIAEIKTGTYKPVGKTQEVVVLGRTGTAVSHAACELPARLPVIGISAFEQGGPWSQERYLISGFRRDLIAALVRFREWVLVEGTPKLGHKEGGKPGSNSLDYQLEGAYFEDQGTFRLVITLKDVKTARFIWSEPIVFHLENWFHAQQQVVRRLSAALNIYLSVDRLTQLAKQPDVSMEIYDRWLVGQDLNFRWQPDARDRASEIFESIIAAAPNFAPAYSSLAQMENTRQLAFPGVPRSHERQKKSLELAKTAVLLDPLDTRTQLCLAWSYAMSNKFEQAELNFRLAHNLNECDPWTIVSSAMGLAFCGNLRDALALARQARNLELAPSPSHWAYQSCIAFLAGDYEMAVSAGEQAQAISCDVVAWHAAALALLGRTDEARIEGERFLEMTFANWHGENPPAGEEVGAWLLDAFPIKDTEACERLRRGLTGAGVPAPD